MTSGPIGNRARVALGVFILTLGMGTTWATGKPFTQLMARLAARRGGSVTFIAHTYAPGLTRPLVSSGILTFRAPDYLAQRTLKPVPSEFVIDGEHMTVHREGETYRLNLRNYPEIAVYVDALREILDGRSATLRRLFAIRWHGTLAAWRLTLKPIQANTHIRQIRLAGAGTDIQRIEILAPRGARTSLRLRPPATTP